ncbi:unnamed protein product [Aspergillus oryzae var. brunneus]|uniref:Unnamed protein product n=2 Tax=Aspergillus oryzae TaxID=5062 RepID=A0AAN4YX98_ASPOZ|nr:unnamed protein product [Aspergillus oryzae]GMG50507.1 unnamed protein product [Aspergillus oryzae var. brunneus]
MSAFENRSWDSLPDAISSSVKTLNHALNDDAQWQAFIRTDAISEPVIFGIRSSAIDDAVLVTVGPGSSTVVSCGSSSRCDFVLVAEPSHWEEFFSAHPRAPYTSFVGIQVGPSFHGEGPQEIMFLHTAGSDSRQYHAVMNDPTMRRKCKMIAFDLPAHGRSFPGENHIPGNYTNTEDAYVGAVREMVKVLKLNKPIICGASMAGQVCIAVAIRAEEVGAGGTIPLQACDYLAMERHFDDKSPFINQSLFNPNWIYGVMAPSAPLANKKLIWHLYSGQAYGIFHGDLDFYLGGFDARSRLSQIDVKKCPVYFLTGEFDWGTTPDMSHATAVKIKGAEFKRMHGLGHFPATENPSIFVCNFPF